MAAFLTARPCTLNGSSGQILGRNGRPARDVGSCPPHRSQSSGAEATSPMKNVLAPAPAVRQRSTAGNGLQEIGKLSPEEHEWKPTAPVVAERSE